MAIADPSSTIAPDAVRPSSASPFRDRLLAWRDRLLADPAFQRAAARFPLTGWLARRRSRQLFDVVAGFAYSQVLLACVRIGLFELLLERPRSRQELALHAGLGDDATGRLLAAAVALRLVEPRGAGRFGLGPLGAPMAGGRAITAMVEHHAALYADLADPLALLRGRPSTARSHLGDVWGYAASAAPAALEDGRVADYSALMTASQPLVADQILDAYRFDRHRRLLDVGGGEAAFAIAVARRHPHLALTVFDLPAVVARAEVRLLREDLSSRIATAGGDFTRDALPTGSDIATLVRVIHDHDDAQALRILRAVHAALATDGVLLVAEPMSGTPGAEAMGDAYFGMYLLAMGSGRPRTSRELVAMLKQAGFRTARLLPTSLPLQTRVVAARK